MKVRWAAIAHAPTSAPWLGQGELDRLAALRDVADRQRFVGARILVRQVVAQETGCGPSDVVLVQRCPRCGGPHGRPRVLVAGRQGPEVSISHAGGLAIVAVGRVVVGRVAIGVDVEPIAAGNEGTDVDSLRDWVRREAVLKATDQGVDQDPSPVRLGPPSEPPRLIGWTGPGRRPTLRIADLVTEPGYIAAVARRGRRPLRVDAGAVNLDHRAAEERAPT